MSEIPFYETRMGHTFYEHTMPQIAKNLETIAKNMNAIKQTPSAGNRVDLPINDNIKIVVERKDYADGSPADILMTLRDREDRIVVDVIHLNAYYYAEQDDIPSSVIAVCQTMFGNEQKVAVEKKLSKEDM